MDAIMAKSRTQASISLQSSTTMLGVVIKVWMAMDKARPHIAAAALPAVFARSWPRGDGDAAHNAVGGTLVTTKLGSSQKPQAGPGLPW